MSYAVRDRRGRIVFRDRVGYAEQPLLIPHGVAPTVPAADVPAVDPDRVWSDIYAAIWAFTDHWISVARDLAPSTNNDRIMRQFLAEWSPLITQRQQIGATLHGAVAQKAAVVIAVGRLLQRLVTRAHQLGIPDPPIDLERDRSWLYLTPDATFR